MKSFKRKSMSLTWLSLLLLVFAGGCDSRDEKSEWRAPTEAVEPDTHEGPTITIGDVDPDTPTSRVQKIRPLADYVAAELNWHPSRVQIMVARSLDDIAVMMKEGRVDLFVDSAFPNVEVSGEIGSTIILQSLVDGQKFYRSLIVVRLDSEVQSIQDVPGRRLAFQEEYSTSGFLVPAALMLEAGFELYQTDEGAPIDAGRVGYLFSGDEENTLAMLRKGIVEVGAISSQDYDQLPSEVKSEFRVVHQSIDIPRKLASVRPGFDDTLLTPLREALVAIDDADRVRMVEAGGWNWEFVALDETSRASITKLEEMMNQVVRLREP